MSVPGDVLQVARVYADYAASRGGQVASVSYSALRRQTHRRNERIADAHEYLTTYGWLMPQPSASGQRRTYRLMMGRPGPARWRPLRTGGGLRPTSPDGGRAPADLSGRPEGTSPDGGSASSPDGGRQTSTSDILRPSGDHDCHYVRCRTPHIPIEDGADYHVTCGHLAHVTSGASSSRPPFPAQGREDSN
jgi:hypothetical protein